MILLERPFSINLIFNQMSILYMGCTESPRKVVPLRRKPCCIFQIFSWTQWVYDLFSPLLLELQGGVHLNRQWEWKKLIPSTLGSPSTGLKGSSAHHHVFALWCLLLCLSCCPGNYFPHKVRLIIWLTLSFVLFHLVHYLTRQSASL